MRLRGPRAEVNLGRHKILCVGRSGGLVCLAEEPSARPHDVRFKEGK
jgi:hypothetical protein